ncbi:hypothetical protein [Rufibacter immobilis]|uniref:hypothetical protein n=1 Tax=Rufibacter immobilis TaxID=1348778 RepID=UPI0035EAA52E
MLTRFKKLNTIGAVVLALTGAFACERTSPSNTDPNNQPRTRAEEDLAELRAWMDEKTERLDSTGPDRSEQVKEEFKQRTAQLDSRLDSLSAKSKEEYKELRRKYQNWEARNAQRTQLPLRPETLHRFHQTLLGSATALDSTIPAHQIAQVYSQFVQNVRLHRDSWTASDWDYVDEIYGRLNQKEDLVENQVTAKDKIKIRALQAEYLTMETSHDAKNLYKQVK